MKLTLPTDSNERKGIPLYSGCYSYFPAALAGVAMHSKINNEKHNPGEPLHHSRGKSSDHADCIARHSMDLADMLARKVVWTKEERDAILSESRALSWRSLAWAQEIEEMFGAPLAPAARLPENKTAVGKPGLYQPPHFPVPPMSYPVPKTRDCAVHGYREPTGWELLPRPHEHGCDLDANHHGGCRSLEPKQPGAHFGSPASDQLLAQSGQTLAPDRACAPSLFPRIGGDPV